MSHTPGPWESRRFDEAQIVVLAENRLVCVCTGDDREANGEAIKALPDLLEACKAALRIKELWVCDSIDSDFWEGEAQALESMRQKLVNAVLKAEGREPVEAPKK